MGRELADSPIVLMTAYAVRGLDINTSYTIYRLLNEQKKNGVGRHLCGRGPGCPAAAVRPHPGTVRRQGQRHSDARTTTKEEVGLRMTDLQNEKEVRA